MSDEEIDDLELILNKICENNQSVYYKYFQDEKGHPFGIEDDEKSEKYFIKLTAEFEKAEIAYYNNASYVLAPINNECLKFKNNGGFRSFFNKTKNKEISRIRKETQEEMIRKGTIENFKYGKWGFYLAITSIIITVLLELLK